MRLESLSHTELLDRCRALEARLEETGVFQTAQRCAHDDLLAQIPARIISFFPDGTIITCNPAFAELVRRQPHELVGQKYFDHLHGNALNDLERSLASATPDSPLTVHEEVHARQDGRHVTMEWHTRALFDAAGMVDHYVAIGVDVTRRRIVEEQLWRSRERYTTVLQTAMDGFWVTDPAGRLLDVNDTYCRMSGYTREELLGEGIDLLEALEGPGDILQRIRDLVDHGPQRFQSRHRHRDGTVFEVEVSCQHLPIDGGITVAFIRDLTGARAVEQRLQMSEERYRRIFETVSLAIIYRDADGRILSANPAALRLFNASASELLGGRLAGVRWGAIRQDGSPLPIEERPSSVALSTGQQCGPMVVGLVDPERHKTLWLLTTSIPVHLSGSTHPDEVISIYEDNTPRLKAEHALEQSERRFRTLAENSLTGIYIIADGVLSYVNPAFAAIFGLTPEEVLGRPPDALTHPDDRHIVTESLERRMLGEIPREKYEIRGVRKNGDIVHLLVLGGTETLDGRRVVIGNTVDITQQKLAENDLRDKHRTLQAILEHLPIGFAINRISTGEATFVSRRFCEIYGVSLDELTSVDTFFDLVYQDPEQREALRAKVSEDVASGDPSRMHWDDIHFVTRAGEHRIITASNIPLMEQDMIISIVQDMTSARHAEEELEQSHRLMQYIIEHNRSAIAVHDRDLRYVYVSRKYLDDYHIAEDIIGRHHYEVFPDLPQKWRDVHQLALQGRVSSAEDDIFERADGTVEWTRWECRPWYEADETVGGFIIYTEMITERKRAEIKLAESQAHLEAVVNSTRDLIWSVDPDRFGLLGWNLALQEALQRMRGMEVTVGCTPSELYDDDPCVAERWVSMYRRVLTDGPYTTEYSLASGDGILHLSFNILVRKDQVFGISVFGKDITGSKRMQVELVAAKEAAEGSDRLKSSLLLNLNHEFRTPMNGILGFAALIGDRSQDAEVKRMAQSITKAGERLMKTLSDIVDFAQLQSNAVQMSRTRVDVTARVQTLVHGFELRARERHLTVSFSMTGSIDAVVDATLLDRAISEVVDNAIKFTPSGSIFVDVDTVIWQGVPTAEVRVTDTGIGIDPRNHGIIFESFRQVSEGFNRSHEGSGLGLTIAQLIVELMGGGIELQSTPGRGSTFILRVPTGVTASMGIPARQTTPTVTEHPRPDRLRLLLVEDNEENAYITRMYLKQVADVDVAADAVTAIDKVRWNSYDAILMDINLGSGVDGLEATRRIRELPEYTSIPIVALTGYTLHADKDRLIAGGCSHYLGKPFTRRRLLQVLDELFPRGLTPMAPPEH